MKLRLYPREFDMNPESPLWGKFLFLNHSALGVPRPSPTGRPIPRPHIRMGQNGQKLDTALEPIPKMDGRGVRDDPNPTQIWASFAWPRITGAGLSLPPLVLPWPACLPPKTQPPRTHLSPAPPPPQDRRFATAVDAGHRRRDTDKRCGSIGHGPALSRPHSSVGGHRRRRCCPLPVVRPPIVSSFVVAARGEFSCTVLPGRRSARTTIACRSLLRYWIASCEVFDEMGELKFVPFHL
jgi:hypothetical protein